MHDLLHVAGHLGHLLLLDLDRRTLEAYRRSKRVAKGFAGLAPGSGRPRLVATDLGSEEALSRGAPLRFPASVSAHELPQRDLLTWTGVAIADATESFSGSD